jgi:phosphoenolpyruvate carboxykinase (ATP)
MIETGIKPSRASAAALGISEGIAHWNLSASELTAIALRLKQAKITSSGALSIETGEFTGRSPKDKFIVKDGLTENVVWWNNFNIPFDAHKFDQLYDKMIKYFNQKEIYIRNVFACADPRYRININILTETPWANLFVHNMFINPTENELEDFEAEWLVLNAPGFHADPAKDSTRQHNFSIINFSRKIILIGGSGYTGEIKKGIFTALNFIFPQQRNVLSMHCAANVGIKGDTAIFFGLSGTGKTTLSADHNRKLIGDDEHGWTSDNVIFNFEGGCYAKTIDLTVEKEPQIFNAIRPGALLENVGFFGQTNEVNYADRSITENTRVSYPIDFIPDSADPSLSDNPKNIFFLTCDAFGVLPPIARLNAGQAAFHFISGYTAKIAGTEADVIEPVMTFSTCFGAPFMPLHPTQYAEMLGQKMKDARVKVWLVNTGWSGGAYGTGKRINLSITRTLISAALNGEFNNSGYEMHDVFGILMPTHCAGVPAEVLNPKNTWIDKDAYHSKATYLAEAFMKNFEKFAAYSSKEILDGGPLLEVRR